MDEVDELIRMIENLNATPEQRVEEVTKRAIPNESSGNAVSVKKISNVKNKKKKKEKFPKSTDVDAKELTIVVRLVASERKEMVRNVPPPPASEMKMDTMKAVNERIKQIMEEEYKVNSFKKPDEKSLRRRLINGMLEEMNTGGVQGRSKSKKRKILRMFNKVSLGHMRK